MLKHNRVLHFAGNQCMCQNNIQYFIQINYHDRTKEIC